MAELIIGLIALPALYLVGDFYCRAGWGLWRILKASACGSDAAAEAEAVPGEGRYDVALAAAAAIVRELAARPEMTQAERLSTLTFTILRTMGDAEGQRPVRLGFEPGDN
jgi:hypothetical protein